MMSAAPSMNGADLAHIDFGPDPDTAPYVDAARRIAATLDLADPAMRSAGARRDAARRIAALGLDQLLAGIDPRQDAPPLLFDLAEVFGHANPAAGWQALAPLPATLLGLDGARDRLALPAGARCWALWLAAGAASGAALYWVDAARMQLRGPVPEVDGALPVEWQHGLCGLPEAALAVLRDSAALRDSGARPLDVHAWQACLGAWRALLSGLICGACRRLREEAFTYAQVRRSGGKPIVQLQAVALRLANIALAEQNLALYAAAAARPGQQGDPVTAIGTLDAAYVTESALLIARDAMQVAAAHGYVEGLPFKALFEQVHTLSSVLSSCALANAGEDQ